MIAALACLVVLSYAPGDDEAFFERKIRPILVDSCGKCHGGKKQEAGLRLDGREAILQGGDSGPAIVPGKPGESLIIRAVRHEGDLAMPPGKTLSKESIADLSAWVERGASWPSGTASPIARVPGEITDADRRFWSFRPVSDPPAPSAQSRR